MFQRSPRLIPEVPGGQTEIPPPPPAPTQTATSIIPVVLGGAGSIVSLLMMVLMNRSGNPWMYAAYSLTGVAGMTYSLYAFFAGRRAFRRAVHTRESRYGALVDSIRAELEQMRSVQRESLCQKDPGPDECTARMARLDSRLWERSPGDADFLALRCGLGSLPGSFGVKVSRQGPTLDPDPLTLAPQRLADEFAFVSDLPVLLPLGDVSAVGIAGSRAAAVAIAKALVLQLACHHAPSEVKLALVYPAVEAAEWAWVRWLPHLWSEDRRQRYLAWDPQSAPELLGSLFDLFQRRRLMRTMAQGEAAVPGGPRFVVIVADQGLAANQPVVPLLLQEGIALGATTIVLAERREELPKECQVILEVDRGVLIQTHPVRRQISFTPDALPPGDVERSARALAAVRLQQMASPAELPPLVTLLDLFGSGAGKVDGLDLLARWRANEASRGLATPLGVRAGGDKLLLDLHERGHGPHGLVAGATGSGKSELLQSLIVSLAINYHPHEVAFVLVDYKGGGMANIFAEMPHLVGTITNLQGNLAVRALSALKGELKRRQRVLGEVGVTHIDEYQRLRRRQPEREPLPHLILIVDEFAELKTEQPDFMRELISAVRVGRSLGVHLILATQKPAGVVDEQIWSNARFRLCLRVERPEDSHEVLRRPDASSITGAGRAYFQVGNNEIYECFQAAWGGAAYAPGNALAINPYEITEVGLDGRRYPLTAPQRKPDGRPKVTQLAAVVGALADAARAAGLQRLAGPWLPALGERIGLEPIRATDGWLEPVVGLVDDPANQSQDPLRLNLGREGHLAVYGSPGSGKTTFLQTLVMSLAQAHPPDALQIYLLDCGGRALCLFAPLPHVGSVVLADETERVTRLFQLIQREMDSRKELLARAGATTFGAYREACRAAGEQPLPALLLGIDNYGGFTGAYGDLEEPLAVIVREGGNLGVHVVLTAHTAGAVRNRVSSNINLALALSMTDRSEYGLIIGRTGGLEPAPVPGRGLVKGTPPLEFQTALAVDADSEIAYTAGVKRLVAQIGEAWSGARAPAVAVLPDEVFLGDVITAAGADLAVPIGLEVDSLAPALIDLHDGPYFLVTGPIQSGKSTFLHSWAISLAQRLPPSRLQLFLFDGQGDGLAMLGGLPQVRACISSDAQFTAALDEISEALHERRQHLDAMRGAGAGTQNAARDLLDRYPALLLLIDDYDGLRDTVGNEGRDRLDQMVRRERGLGFFLGLAGSSGALASSYDGLARTLKEFQTGVLLGSSDHGDLAVLNLRLPSGEGGKSLPPGQGFYVRRGRYRKIKAAIPHGGGMSLDDWVRQIERRAHIEKEGEDAWV